MLKDTICINDQNFLKLINAILSSITDRFLIIFNHSSISRNTANTINSIWQNLTIRLVFIQLFVFLLNKSIYIGKSNIIKIFIWLYRGEVNNLNFVFVLFFIGFSFLICMFIKSLFFFFHFEKILFNDTKLLVFSFRYLFQYF